MIHTKECTKRIKEFTNKYPNYCKTCGGWGGFVEYNYPNEPDEFIECSNCIGAENPKCALCGEPIPKDFWGDDYIPNHTTVLPCGHLELSDDGFPYCDCGIYPICETDLVEMEFLSCELTHCDGAQDGYYIEYEIEVYRCPICGKEKRI